MKITFLGGVGTVTGSMYLIHTNRQMIMMECGLFQGRRAESYTRNKNIPVDIRRLDAVILSHAHIDHSGNIPNLITQGYEGSIYTTHATRDLCGAMLPDSGRIHEHDIQYINRKRKRKGQSMMEPLYTEEDALRSLSYFVGVGYNRPREIARGVRLTFLDAGHILGSSLVLLEVDEAGETKRLLFTGDLGQPNLPIVRDPTPMPEADILMIESTYGDRLHPAVEAIQNQLEDIVKRVVERGGRIIVPAFAVGRTQEIVYDLHQLCYTDRIPELAIYVDSPLALNVTEVFRLHADCYDAETRSFILDSGEQDPFGFYRLKYVRSVAESKRLNVTPNPIIIISASGMAEAGRVQHHLKLAIVDPRNAVLITGWQAPHTLGRRIAEKQPFVSIYGESYPLRAEVHTLYGYSAHADKNDLLNWSRPHASTVKTAFVVHGDPEQSHALALGLQENGYQSVIVPQKGDIANV